MASVTPLNNRRSTLGRSSTVSRHAGQTYQFPNVMFDEALELRELLKSFRSGRNEIHNLS